MPKTIIKIEIQADSFTDLIMAENNITEYCEDVIADHVNEVRIKREEMQ